MAAPADDGRDVAAFLACDLASYVSGARCRVPRRRRAAAVLSALLPARKETR